MVLNLMLIGLAVALDPLPLSAFMIVLPGWSSPSRWGTCPAPGPRCPRPATE
jgi:hypothetical protein